MVRASAQWAVLVLAVLVSHGLAIAAAPQPLQAPASSQTQDACFGLNGVDDSYIPAVVSSLRIALVQPVLTSTPYSQYGSGSFYEFYAKESGVTTNVTTNLDLLSTNVSSGLGYNGGWGLSYGEYEFFTSHMAANCGLLLGRNVQVLTDMEVADGSLFDKKSGAALFDVVVLPFSEYVEASEYAAYEDFVADGGTLVVMGHSLEYPVSYNATSKMETLVYGHNWAFNGRYAYPIACGSNTYVDSCPWAKNNTEWMGSNTCEASCFHTYKFNGSAVNPSNPIGRALSSEFGSRVFVSYISHEEDTVTNMTRTSIVSVFANDSRNLIASYTHQFRKGVVVGWGFFGDDIIAVDRSAQYFMLLGITYGRGGPTTPASSSIASAESASIVATTDTSTVPQSLSSTSAAHPADVPALLVVPAAVIAVVLGVLLSRRRTSQGRPPGQG
jgi:hypothetical protein